MTIEEYLHALDRELRGRRGLRRRLLAEAEDHLREAAAEVGDEEAVRRFGPAPELARELAPRLALSSVRTAALLLVALALSVPLLYPIPENNLPPAPWPEGGMPARLAWKQDAVLVLFFVGLGASAIALAAFRRPRVLVPAAGIAFVALTGMTVLGTILSFQWADAVPGTPSWLVLVSIFQLGLAAAGAAFGAQALLLRRFATTR